MLVRSNDLQGFTQEEIFNSYTGKGGLHELSREDFSNYHEFSSAKKEIEIGQFWTPPDICQQLVDIIRPSNLDVVADLCCGIGNFFNYLPCEQNAYGCDIDRDVVTIAKFLYPKANIQVRDIQFYQPEIKFDTVFGNPPFNLRIAGEASQMFYVAKAAELLKPAGLLVVITPLSFLADDFMDGGDIARVNENYNFICQFQLPANAFRNLGVDHFETKVMILQRKSEHLPVREYRHDSFVEYDIDLIRNEYVLPILKEKETLRARLLLEFHRSKVKGSFDYKVLKYLYQIRIHKKTMQLYNKCLEFIDKFKKQEKPENMSFKEWARIKITENKVLAYLKKQLKKQHAREQEKIALVKSKYSYKLKAYSAKTKLALRDYNGEKSWNQNDLILKGIPSTPFEACGFKINPQTVYKSLRRKAKDFKIQSFPFGSMDRDPEIDRYVRDFVFKSQFSDENRFNETQIRDLGLLLQKPRGILNWQQGSGKTPAAYAFAKYHFHAHNCRNVFISGPALAINLTWKPFLELHREKFVLVESLSDLNRIRPGQFVIISLNFLIKFQTIVKKLIRRNSQKVVFIFDESEESTNHNSKRTKAALSCFRRCRYKLLATGTTTRNNINELYGQIELLYNNSVNMLCECAEIHYENRDKKSGDVWIEHESNSDYMKPYSARHGLSLFKASFNPSKTTVFGIQKQNQDIFNVDQLKKLIEKTIITRKFKEIVGSDKYSICTHKIKQNRQEEIVYDKIINELEALIPQYFKNTGNSNKEAMLKIIRQIQLLIKATSTPHLFKEYGDVDLGRAMPLFPTFNTNLPKKTLKIIELIKSFENEKVALGCTTIDASDFYYRKLQEVFPRRPLFLIQGDINVRKRSPIIKDFEASKDGILVSTQQSLKSSVNIPSCQRVIVESLQWNIPKIEQYYFRFVRYDSPYHVQINLVGYENTIEVNLMALLIAKERLNEFIKTLELKDHSEIFQEYDLDQNLVDMVLRRFKDEDGKFRISWGKQSFN